MTSAKSQQLECSKWWLLFLAIVVSMFTIIQVTIFAAKKGEPLPRLIIRNIWPPETCNLDGCYAKFPDESLSFQYQYFAQYQDGHAEYAQPFTEYKENGKEYDWYVLHFNQSDGIEKICAKTLTLRSWQTASCMNISADNFRFVVTYELHGFLLFELVFSFSFVADLLCLLSRSDECCFNGEATLAGKGPFFLGIGSLILCAIILVINAAKPDLSYALMIVLSLISFVRCGCLWTAFVYQWKKHAEVEMENIDEKTPLKKVNKTTENGKENQNLSEQTTV